MKSHRARQDIATPPFASGLTLHNAAHSIADELRDRILSGELKPKTRLTQRDLAAEFGLSSMPARDAIKLLISEGLAIQESSKTIVVAPINPEDFADIMEVRTLLEPRALELSIPQMSKADIAHCDAMLRLSGTTNHPMAFVENHWNFHRSIYRRAGRPRLLSIIETQHTHLIRYLMPNWALIGVWADWAEGETELMRLVREKRVGEAVRYLRDDLEKTAQRVLKAMPG
jgi:DNA-binding GntR family transcriptional regulator